MNNRTLLAAVALSMTSVAPLASAASDAPYLGIQGSYQIPDQDRLTRDGYGGTLLLGAPINDYLAGELNLFAKALALLLRCRMIVVIVESDFAVRHHFLVLGEAAQFVIAVAFAGERQ